MSEGRDRDYTVQFFEDSSARTLVADMNYCIRAGEDATIGQILDREIRNNPSLSELYIVVTPV